MPPKCKFTRTEIVDAALKITRESGYSAVTARSVAATLCASPKVIFSSFASMDALQAEVLCAAENRYQQYLAQDIASGKFPPYKASGMAYIRFATEEKELFKLLFMRDRSAEAALRPTAEYEQILTIIEKNLCIHREAATAFHQLMWIYVHGIATMMATNYLTYDTDTVSALLTDAYEGQKMRYCRKDNA